MQLHKPFDDITKIVHDTKGTQFPLTQCPAPVSVSLDAVDNIRKLQYAAIEPVQIGRMKRVRKSLRAIRVPTIKKDALGEMSISLGPELDVGADDAPPSRISDTFFAPCDWPLDILEDQTWDERGVWSLEHVTPDPAILLQFLLSNIGWYEHCLYRLPSLVPNLWDFYMYVQVY
ncbi:hypothetical protein NLG97_g2942 [Lecanicillium saksenae]|uniref:Uncharacterized protein n=1 Tax=Lecanicillium saksenae TaxID=468837 RepID=A0ACC1QZJ9_9HYPO|nr:hypothetical protein NLG97_g2942 [Lecanicillium saksenae]